MSKCALKPKNSIPETSQLIEQMQLPEYLKRWWPEIKERILNGTYRRKPVRQVEIPRPNGGTRLLGIPTVLDRLIQQAMHQVLMPLFEPGFSAHSFGFRPGRSAHQAVLQAREPIRAGKRGVVDMDLARFFDEVNRDKSAVSRPWSRKFLGYTFTMHKQIRIRIAPESMKKFRKNLKHLFRKGRGRNLARCIQKDLNPTLMGGINDFSLSETRGFAEDLDQ